MLIKKINFTGSKFAALYTQFDPPSDLKHVVCFFYAMEHHAKDGIYQPLLPSGTEINGWQYKGNWRLQFTDSNILHDFLLPDFYMVGQQTTSYKLTPEPEIACIFGATLQPGTIRALTSRPAYLFTNTPADLITLFPRQQVMPYIKKFKRAENNSDRLSIVSNFYRQFVIEKQFSFYNEALQMIYQNKGCITVKQILEKLHINERYLQREFRKHIGISPSAYLQIIRFNNIFTELSLSEERQNIAMLATLFNYYDISHFSKTYKRYFGASPSKQVWNKLKLLRELIKDSPYLLQVQDKNIL